MTGHVKCAALETHVRIPSSPAARELAGNIAHTYSFYSSKDHSIFVVFGGLTSFGAACLGADVNVVSYGSQAVAQGQDGEPCLTAQSACGNEVR
jgi:hypothetical protein